MWPRLVEGLPDDGEAWMCEMHVRSCNKILRKPFCDKCHRCALHHLLAQGEHETQCPGPGGSSSPDKLSWRPSRGSQVMDLDFFFFLSEFNAWGGLINHVRHPF